MPAMKHITLAVTLCLTTEAFSQQAPSVSSSASPIAAGQTVTELGTHIMCMHQAKDSALWFGSNGQGVYRCDGKVLVRYTTENGIAGDDIRCIQEDLAGNVFLYSEPGGVTRFDGRGFSILTSLDASKSEWKLGPDDLWFPAGQDSGAVYRWDGTSLHRLTFPATEAGDAHFAALPRSKYPNAKYSPYDVYTILKDSKGRVWFGTSTLGACRYDGSSFVWVGHGENGSFGVRSIVEDKDGKFWLSNTISRFAELPAAPAGAAQPAGYRKEQGVATRDNPNSPFVSAVWDKDGTLWIAMLGGSVCRYDGTTWAQFLVQADGKPIWLTQLLLDRQGRLWVGTQGKGVYRFDGAAFARVMF